MDNKLVEIVPDIEFTDLVKKLEEDAKLAASERSHANPVGIMPI